MNTSGLRDILRPIRDGLRDRLPPKKDDTPPPDQEQDIRQKNLDALKGFLYLDTFSELLAWAPEVSDPLQRSNTPLYARPSGPHSLLEPKAKVMLVHDYAGGYHEYESVGTTVEVKEEDFSLGNGEMQFLDSFVYFSHHLVTVPPAAWINTGHRNGVKVLGTFIVEPQTLGVERILERYWKEGKSDGEWVYPVAAKLVEIAAWVGFDGWLVNIEKVFPEEKWDLELMLGFMGQLRKKMEELNGGEAMVVWYDALTESNKLSHQNGLSTANLPFFQACGYLLTNYAWSPQYISKAFSLAAQKGLDASNIYFGIDVWAQNRPRDFLHPRVTWPWYDGGGTNTGFAVAKCAELGVSSGIFAPAWYWQHFGDTKMRSNVSRAMWQGEELDEETTCGCSTGIFGPRDPHRTEQYREYPIMKSAKEFPAGEETFFWTEFERSFTEIEETVDGVPGEKQLRAQLGAQSIIPMVSRGGVRKILQWELRDQPTRLAVVTVGQPNENPNDGYIGLYKLNMSIGGMPMINLRYRVPSTVPKAAVCLILTYANAKGKWKEIIHVNEEEIEETSLGKRLMGSTWPRVADDARLVEIGVKLNSTLAWTSENGTVLELFSIFLSDCTPTTFGRSGDAIKDIKVEVRGRDEWKHLRLLWKMESKPVSEKDSGKTWWSNITGPYAYFVVEVDGLLVGKAFALEIVLSKALLIRWQSGEGLNVQITGVIVGGKRVATEMVHLEGQALNEECNYQISQ